MLIKLDTTAFGRVGDRFIGASKQGPLAVRRALKHTGDKARTAMRKALPAQTGLKAGTINRAVKGQMRGDRYVIESRGGNVRLKYFGARETRKGVSAAPWGHRQVFANTFMRGGHFPNRVKLNMGGHVYRRSGSGRTPIEGGRSGLFIPKEMITGSSERAFYATAERDLGPRVVHELLRILGA